MWKSRRVVSSGLLVAALVLSVGVLPRSAAAADAPYCGIVWGSLAKHVGDVGTYASLVNVRAGRHTCFDRLVVDVSAAHAETPGSPVGRPYAVVQYVDQVREPEGGPVVPVRGGARLVVFVQAPAWGSQGPTYTPAHPAELVDVAGWRTFRQIALAYSFEYGSGIGLGVRARLPFRTFWLAGPGSGSRLVVDVAHRW